MDDYFGFEYPPGVTDRDIAKHDNLCEDGSVVCCGCGFAFDVDDVYCCDDCNADELCEACMDRHICVDGVGGGDSMRFSAFTVVLAVVLFAAISVGMVVVYG